jgi:hypothetical protein
MEERQTRWSKGCGWRWLGAVGLIVTVACGAGFATAQDDGLIPRRVLDPLDQCPCWTGRTDALMLWRDAPQGVGLFDSLGPGAGLNAADLASGMAAGPRFTLFRHTGDLGAIEFNYFRVQDFSGAGTVTGPTTLADGLLCIPGFGAFDRASAGLSSELQSFELNRRFPTDGRVQWLAGFRWFQWNDTLALEGVGLPAGPVTVFNQTNNDLYGFQLGADSILWRPGGRFWVEGLGKAGIYGNRSAQFTALALDDDVLGAGGTSTSRPAFVGELGVTGVWQVTKCIAIRTGWVAFFLDGLALGPNQLGQQCLICANSPRQATVTNGCVFVQGISLGLEARW